LKLSKQSVANTVQQPRILIQLDPDPHASVFDAIVAIDSQVDHLLQYARVDPSNCRQLVHGAMFTRGPAQLNNTAIFIGGSRVSVAEAIGDEVRQSFFGPIRVSVMLDSNGSNTTAAAAVLSAARHTDLGQLDALVLGGTGPVGQRIARLLLRQGASVRLASRDLHRATEICHKLTSKIPGSAERLTPVGVANEQQLHQHLKDASAIFGCGAAGVRLLSTEQLQLAEKVRVAIDLNAVPPEGIQGIAITDKAVLRGQRFDYGAVGVGGLKMKIHREAIRTLFTRNDLLLDAEEIYEIGYQLELAKRS
jgi:methylenetetrahydrofolate/methylenetetrahydromethanopterin dehydrogenase (NADP+)